jgi:hypothetical protein
MGTPSLTPYEAAIRENIRRNQAVMEALGLGRLDACRHEELRSASAPEASGGAEKGAAAGKGKAAKQADADDAGSHREAVRRSQRLAELAGAPTAAEPDGVLGAGAAGKRRRAADDVECSGEHKSAREDHLRWAGSQRKSSIVGSASYEHTLHRVMTMSESQLARRIVAIERACGQHAVVKMKLFASVLALEGHAGLAEDAAAAYARLVAQLGLPEGADEADDE